MYTTFLIYIVSWMQSTIQSIVLLHFSIVTLLKMQEVFNQHRTFNNYIIQYNKNIYYEENTLMCFPVK